MLLEEWNFTFAAAGWRPRQPTPLLVIHADMVCDCSPLGLTPRQPSKLISLPFILSLMLALRYGCSCPLRRRRPQQHADAVLVRLDDL